MKSSKAATSVLGKLAMNGAESVSPARARAFIHRFSKWGLPPEAMTPVYGLSEASLAVTFSDPHTKMNSAAFDSLALSQGTARIHDKHAKESAHVELTSVGKPLRGFDIAIRTPDGTTCAEGVLGHLWVTVRPSCGDIWEKPKVAWLTDGSIPVISALYKTENSTSQVAPRMSSSSRTKSQSTGN